jgi:Rod binding domain-containing protein
MTSALNPLAQINAAVQQQGGKDANAKLHAAARQFEGVLLTQLLQVLWKTTPELSQGAGSMYQSMFQSSFADQLAAGGGIGLADMIAKGLGATPELPGAGLTKHTQATDLRVLGPQPAAAAKPHSVMGDVSAAANGLLADGGKRWGKSGELGPQDLGSMNASAQAGEQARRTVDGANGYRGYYKCNLFAFELARRAGLEVPQLEGGKALDFPSSNRLTQDASDGSLDTGWAKVATGASPAAMQDALRAGEAAFLLVGSGHGERHGHMAIVEQPRAIDYDEAGQIRSISFQGWEAQPDGAKHLTTRTWNRTGNSGGPADRNGLDRIEIIQLNRKAAGSHLTTQPPLQSR